MAAELHPRKSRSRHMSARQATWLTLRGSCGGRHAPVRVYEFTAFICGWWEFHILKYRVIVGISSLF